MCCNRSFGSCLIVPYQIKSNLLYGKLSLCLRTRCPWQADIRVDIDRSPDGDIALVQLDAVGIALVPVLDNLALLEIPHVGFDDIADLEAEPLGHTTGHESVPEEFVVEILSDKDKAGFAFRLGFRPLALVKATGKDHTNTLEDEFLVHALDGKDSLVAVEVSTVFRHKALDPSLHEIDIDGISLDLAGNGRDSFVVHVLAVLVQKVGLELEDTVQLKGLDVQEFLGADLAVLGLGDCDSGIELLDFSLNLGEFRGVRNKIDLVEKNLVGKGDLFDGFVLDTLWLFLVEAFHNVLGVHDRNDGIEAVHELNVLVHEKGLDDGGRIGEASGLDNDTIELVDALVKLLEGRDQVSPDRAANAAVHDLNDFLVDVLRQDLLVDAHLTEFIFNDGEFHSMGLVIKNVIEKGCFATSQEAR